MRSYDEEWIFEMNLFWNTLQFSFPDQEGYLYFLCFISAKA